MKIRNNKNGYKILKVTQESEPNGIGFRQLMRKTGLYQKSLSVMAKIFNHWFKVYKKGFKGTISFNRKCNKKI